MNERMIQWLKRLMLCAAFVTHHSSLITALAQDDMKLRQICSQAESNLLIGRTEEARDTLVHYLDVLKGTFKRDALRIMALCSLTEYDEQKAGEYVKMMLEVDPYYSVSSNDPPIFVNIVNELKAGKTATVTTASSMEESLDEVPVPTTLITEEMIRSCGGRNLQEVLAAYVPSMNLIDCNDGINIAMRGIFSNTQEMMLILLNGHRLNSYLTNTAAPDFSISLEKIRQIEVLRGPASSVYGGVALTAVVNIITKEGADVDGIVIKAEAGNHGQLRGDVLMGKRYYGLDVLAWVSGYSCKGEQRTVSEEHRSTPPFEDPIDQVTIGRVGNPPTYDLGVQLKLKGWQLMYNTHFSQVVAPYTYATTAMTYAHDEYRTYDGLSPGFANNAHHAVISYQAAMRHVQLTVNANYDKTDETQYHVFSETPNRPLGIVLGLGRDERQTFANYGGLSRYINGKEENYGVRLKTACDYAAGKDHRGSLVFAAEYEHFHLADINYRIGYDYIMTWEDNTNYAKIFKGHENSADASLQWKHQWRSLILNAGLRYDYKRRENETEANELSPRVALIWLRPRWSVRFSYSKSFVDAPYFYQKSNVASFLNMGGMPMFTSQLEPVRIHSWQISLAAKQWAKGLDVEVNGFLNQASDLITTNMQTYDNSGENRTIGVELTAAYKMPRLTANVNFTYTHCLRSSSLSELISKPEDLDDNNCTPDIVSNAVVAWQATKRLKLHGHLLVEGNQTSYNFDIIRFYTKAPVIGDDVETKQEDLVAKYDMPTRAIVNLGAEYKIGKLMLGLNVHNLFDTRYDRSGMNTALVPQKGRWWTASVSYQF